MLCSIQCLFAVPGTETGIVRGSTDKELVDEFRVALGQHGERGLAWAASSSMAYYMKMTFEIPVPIALRFKASVPRGQRSTMVTRLLESEIRSAEANLEAAFEKANSLKLDTKDWEHLEESDTR